MDDILGIPGLALEQDRRVNMLKLWRLLVFRKLDTASGQRNPLQAVTSGRR